MSVVVCNCRGIEVLTKKAQSTKRQHWWGTSWTCLFEIPFRGEFLAENLQFYMLVKRVDVSKYLKIIQTDTQIGNMLLKPPWGVRPVEN